MKKNITWACLTVSFVTILSSLRIDEVLLRFIIAGEIPGTTYALPALGMLLLCGVIFLSITTALYQVLVAKLPLTASEPRASLSQSE